MKNTNYRSSETNFWKIENGEIICLEYGTKTIAETSQYTPLGSYTSFRTYDRLGVLRLSQHLDRLEKTAQLAGYDIDLDKKALKEVLADLLATSPAGEKRIRITIDLEKVIGEIYIAMEGLHVPEPEKYEQGIVCQTAAAHRDNPKAKLSNFLSRAENIREQEKEAFDEILMVSPDGDLLEGLSSNFFGIIGDTVYTAEEGVLSGTTRDFILHLAEELQIPVVFKPVKKDEIAALDEAFISSTSRAILPIRSIDDIAMKKTVPGPVTKKLMEKFKAELSSGIESLLDAGKQANCLKSGTTLMIDSGVGGISVLALAHQRLPEENFSFYADAAFAPYGDKTPQEIRERLHAILKEYSDQPVKAILLACNTATSAAASVLRQELEIPVIGMEPALKPAVLNSEGQIVVMATALTIREEKFQKLLAQYGAGRDIVPLPCPGLMELVEKDPEGAETEAFLRKALAPYEDTMSSLVLGCTHYVFLRPLLQRMYPQVHLFDGNDGVVRHLEEILREQESLGGNGKISMSSSLKILEKRSQYHEKCVKMFAFSTQMYDSESVSK